ncbi:MAG: hypothetical protein KatS3mg003_1183 [Candidatus Nitrosocaldaceae archaeon]|nr:MAG: hypothetical protein KatS3mg003_1183 [Candidatus Nitrosocaldaceae archaeon]
MKITVIFFGPDGSGKTTQADLLVKYLRGKGVKVRKVWFRSLHTLAFLLSWLFAKLLGIKITDFRMRYRCKKWFKKIWLPIEFISIIPLIIIKAYIPSKLGYSIVAERFIIDWIVMMAYLFRDNSILDSRYAKFLLKFIPHDAILIYIDADYDTIISRRKDDADSLEFINAQRELYNIFAKQFNAYIIDTSKYDIDKTSYLIRSYASKEIN